MQIFISFYFAFRPFFHFSHINKPCNNLITFCDCIADWRIEKGNHHWRVVEGALRCLMPCKSAKTEIKSGLPCPATPSVEGDGGLDILSQLCSWSQRLWSLVIAKLQIQKQCQELSSLDPQKVPELLVVSIFISIITVKHVVLFCKS